ncbi:hypothetical protein AVEN_271475-1 [Araneus ventricosus]|uniref:Uncharacterized protein n=1 Tax=Araneus ventricosus TaxID=182803 RepID=A0A4Y2KN68_ARAVE|nr:hypothetical protein AVEN_271475-1 [Araneus ventricosus]
MEDDALFSSNPENTKHRPGWRSSEVSAAEWRAQGSKPYITDDPLCMLIWYAKSDVVDQTISCWCGAEVWIFRLRPRHLTQNNEVLPRIAFVLLQNGPSI